MDCQELAPGLSRVGLALQYRKDRLTSPLVLITARKQSDNSDAFDGSGGVSLQTVPLMGYCTISPYCTIALAMCDGIIDNFWKLSIIFLSMIFGNLSTIPWHMARAKTFLINNFWKLLINI